MFWNTFSKGFAGMLRIFVRFTVAAYFAVGVLALASAAQANPSSLRELPEALQGAVSGEFGQDYRPYYPEQPAEAPFTQQQGIAAPDGAKGDVFGDSAALSADGATALIGAYGAAVGAKALQGAAYIFVKTGGTWGLQQKLTASDGAPGDEFGASVALSADGSTALIGAWNAAVGANQFQGAAYVFVKSGGTWTQQKKLTASDGAAGNNFGRSAALSADGNTALVGAILANGGAQQPQGAAYVFVRSGAAWSQQGKLAAPDGAARDWFGYSAALSADGATAFVGAYGASVGANTNQGALYVFARSGATWSQQQKLTASDAAPYNYFGCSAALSGDGNTGLIGAYGAAVGANALQGAAYIFVKSGGTWRQQQKLTASDGAAGDSFGYSAGLNGDGGDALIGAAWANGAGASPQGAAYVFVKGGGTWTQQPKLVASIGAAGDEFGWSAALSADGAAALIGAPGVNVGGNTYQGAAYVFNSSNGLVVNLGASGLWFYRSGAWSELTPLTPGIMAAYGNGMVALFQGFGLYRYGGGAWTQLTPISSVDMIVGMPDRVYVDFTGAGLWQYNGAWTRITALNPNLMTAFGNNLLANFPGAGLYQYGGASWAQLTPISTADSMVAGASAAYVDFPSAGLYAYNGSTWTGLTSLNSTMMTMYGNWLVANFAGFGIYSWNGSSWTQLTPAVAQGLIGTSTNLYANFGTSGLFEFNGAWTEITSAQTNLMGSLGSSLIANFPANGLYQYDGWEWSRLTPVDAATSTIQVTWP